jgi:hypothetical protein
VELLVVIAVMGVLVALLLPAVQSARESARKTQCLSQVRQLGLAVLNYESQNGRLPPGGLISPILATANPRCEEFFHANVSACFDAFGVHGGPTLSWIVLLLPFIEEESLYDQFELDKSIFLQSRNPYSQRISSIVCPSDGSRGPAYDGSRAIGREPMLPTCPRSI